MPVYNKYKCTLNEEDIYVAEKELNEPKNCDVRQQKIDMLRSFFYSQESKLKLFHDSDQFLIRFLRARNFDMKEALELLNNYHTQLKSWPDVLEKVQDPHLVKHVFDAGTFVILNGKAFDKSAVCIIRLGIATKALFTDHVAALIITIDHLLKIEQNQVYGITLILDRSDVTFELIQGIRPFFGKRFMNLIQRALPVRIKSLNFVNKSKFCDTTYSVFANFLKGNFKSLAKVHDTDFDSLHKIIEPTLLPSKYGGTISDFAVLQLNYLDIVT